MSRQAGNEHLDTADYIAHNHDRIEAALSPVPQVTPVQTMVSAMTGSLLTSLLGVSRPTCWSDVAMRSMLTRTSSDAP